jgi:putative ABC transport system permease protein
MAAIPLFYNFRNLRVRKTTTAMTALGIALTVAVLLGIWALVTGVRSSLEVTGDPLHLIVMRQGSTSELVSIVVDEKFQAVRRLEGVARLDGEPMVSNEVVTVVTLPLRGDPTQEGNINLRGISPMGIKMRKVKITEGRWFDEGKREVVVGRGLHAIRAGTDIGDKISFGRGDWDVVGIFDAGKSAFNSEVWAPGALATSDLGRGSTRSSILVNAQDEVAAKALINRISDDQRLLLEAKFERDYYAAQMSSAMPVQVLGIFVAGIMAIGSCFAAMNTMYTAVARRNREIGVLQMLGFSRSSILVSFVVESLLLSLLGGVIGVLLVLPLNGLNSRIGNFVTFSETTFQFEVTPLIMAMGIGFAAFMGVLGGVLPARMAARKDVLTSLRDL